MNDWSSVYLLVAAWYGTYALLSLTLTVLSRAFLVKPILAHKGIHKPEAVWKNSLIWGYWLLWQYFIAVILLIAYQTVFRVILKLTRYDPALSSFWNEKERKFIRSTPKSLFEDWTRDHFSQYYSEWKP